MNPLRSTVIFAIFLKSLSTTSKALSTIPIPFEKEVESHCLGIAEKGAVCMKGSGKRSSTLQVVTIMYVYRTESFLLSRL